MKRKIDYELRYKVDEENRCVVCWLNIDERSLLCLIDDCMPKNFKPDPFFFPPIKIKTNMKAIAFAHDGDPWDPEGLMKLARKKALRKMNEKLMKCFDRLTKDFSRSCDMAEKEYTKYLIRYGELNEEITGSEYYEKWRENSEQK